MKKLLVIFCMATMMAACGESAKNNTSGADTDAEVEENSGDVISPLEDSTGMATDSLESPMETDSIQ